MAEGSKSADHLYYITYEIKPHPEGVTKAQVSEMGDVGACDAILLASVIYPANGGFSLVMASVDGKKDADMEPAELWKIWTMMAHDLAGRETLSPAKRALCQHVHDTVRAAVLAMREAEPVEPN